MSELELEVKRGDLAIRVKGNSNTELLKRLKEALSLLDEASKQVGKTAPPLKTTSKDLPPEPLQSETPSISGVKTCRDAILKLLATPWGRTPRSQAEIRQAMEVNAIYYGQPVVATELRRMTKVGLLRRLKLKDGYAYVLARPP